MKISIAMATYNGAKYLQAQLDSIVAQTRCPDELVICDDGSHDETVDIIERFIESKRLPVRFYPNVTRLGFAANFEKAITLCNGDIIVLCDQDDVWYSDKLETLELVFNQSKNVGFVISNADIIDAQAKKVGETLWQRRNFSFEEQESLCNENQFECILRYAISTGMVSAFTKHVRKIAGPLPERISHDRWYILVAAGIDINGVIISRSLAGYRQHERQLVGTRKPKLSQKIFKQYHKKKHSLEKQMYHRLILLNRINTITSNIETKQVLCLKENIYHLKIRVEVIQSVLWKRLCLVIHELVSGRYKKFSGNMVSVFSDLVLPFIHSIFSFYSLFLDKAKGRN